MFGAASVVGKCAIAHTGEYVCHVIESAWLAGVAEITSLASSLFIWVECDVKRKIHV